MDRTASDSDATVALLRDLILIDTLSCDEFDMAAQTFKLKSSRNSPYAARTVVSWVETSTWSKPKQSCRLAQQRSPMARILLVDDDEDFRCLLLSILAGENNSVVCAANGVEAIEHFRAQSFDLVITDLVMPEKEGIETIIELRKTHPRVRIIAMTGGSANAAIYLQLADSFGVSRTLTKPFTRSDLLAAVASVLMAA